MSDTNNYRVDGKNFIYTCEDGTEISVPRARYAVKVGWLRRNRNLEPSELGFRMLETALTEEQLAKLDDLYQGEFNDFMNAWQQEGTPNLGE